MTADRPVVAELAAVWSSLLGLAAELSDDDWDRPTGCPGWSVRDVYSHVIGTESALLGRDPAPPLEAYGPHVRNDMGRGNEAEVLLRRDRPGPAIVAELEEVTAARLSALRAIGDEGFAAETMTPAGPGTYGDFMAVRVFDCWVHEQDVRRAVGRPGHLSGPAVDRSLASTMAVMPYVVGKRAGAPEGATVAFDVTGQTARRWAVAVVDGRAKSVPEVPQEPTVRISADVSTYMALACGRVDPDEELAAGRVAVHGDREIGTTVVRNLGYTI
jgi:uncharacterized protein (TIGR03083 family)